MDVDLGPEPFDRLSRTLSKAHPASALPYDRLVFESGMDQRYYDDAAIAYDDSRGGLERARAAALAIGGLVPPRGRCLDVAGGTGIVSAELAAQGRALVVVDLSFGMLSVAARRLPGRVVQGLGDRLPVADRSVDLVTCIWMLNLVSSAMVDAVLVEASRVLRVGGHLVITVDKELSHSETRLGDNDKDERVTTLLARHGLARVGTTTFSGRSPWGSTTDGDPVFRLASFALHGLTDKGENGG